MSSLREKATSGVLWSAFERFGEKFCVFGIQLILARILAPEEFGLIALVAGFVIICNALVEGGFGRALIQLKSVSDVELSTVFYFNIFASACLSLLLFCVAPTIAAFYEIEELSVVLQFLCLGLIFEAFATVQRSILSRKMLFKKLFWVSMPSTVCSGTVGIVMALNGYGVWALVAQTLSRKLLLTSFLWLLTGWRPRLIFSYKCLAEMFPYGSRLALSGFLNQGFNNIYVLVIGKIFAPIEVGFFQRAKSFQQLPVANIQSILMRVAFPLFSSIQDDPPRMKRGMRKATQIATILVFPGMALLAVIAEPMVIFLIGEKWLPSIPYLQWLCIVGAMFPLHSLNVNLLAAIGRSDLFLRIEIIKKVLVLANILITFSFGVQAMIYGMCVTSILALAINTHYTQKFIDYGFMEQIRDVLPMFLTAVLVFLAGYSFQAVTDFQTLTTLLWSVAISGFIGMLSLHFMADDLKVEIKQVAAKVPFGKRIASILL
jgi:teichuronic acid exporter